MLRYIHSGNKQGNKKISHHNLKLGNHEYQQNLQWIIYVKYRQMASVIAFDHCLDLRNATHVQHPEGVIFSRCS